MRVSSRIMRSEEPLAPGLGGLLVEDLDVQVILEGPRAAGPDPVDHLTESILETDARLVVEELARLVRGTVGKVDLLRSTARVGRLQIEFQKARNGLRQLVDRDEFFV